MNKTIEFEVKWDVGENTWEPIEHCDELEALDNYLDLQGVKDWRDLPKKRRSAQTNKH